MTYTKKQFLEDVAKEATALKEHATPEEIANLDFESMCPFDENLCVYGQMTSDCTSDRAHELIAKCCVRLVDNHVYHSTKPRTAYQAVNGTVESIKQLDKTRKIGFIKYLSQLEAYIQMPNAKNANLIAFLKGERKDLVL